MLRVVLDPPGRPHWLNRDERVWAAYWWLVYIKRLQRRALKAQRRRKP